VQRKKAQRQTSLLLTVAYRRSKSFTVAMNALTFLVTYGEFIDHEEAHHGKTDDDVRIEDYAAFENISRAQAFRRQQAFRTCFPSDDVLTLWAIVRPLLASSPFKDEHPRAQAAFAGTIKATLS
jgi:hypothetical protein